MAAMKKSRALWDKHPSVRSHDELTFGERAADVMRNCFGSWAFVGGFLAFMAAWMVLNSPWGPHVWDRYPWVLLNLGLSMMAGLQGALILIAAKRADRVAAEQATAHYGETKKLHELAEQIRALTEQQMAWEPHLGQLDAISAAVCTPAKPATPAGDPAVSTAPAPPPAATPAAAKPARARRRPATPG